MRDDVPMRNGNILPFTSGKRKKNPAWHKRVEKTDVFHHAASVCPGGQINGI